MLLIDDPNDGGSLPGAYADALLYSVVIQVSEHEPSVAPAAGVQNEPSGHPIAPHGVLSSTM